MSRPWFRLFRGVLPKRVYLDLLNARAARSARDQASAAAARDALGQVTEEWRGRIDDVLACPELALIERGASAGQVRDGLVEMHNGIRVNALGYYGGGILNLLVEARGVHEPQEEYVFGKLLPLLPPGSVMLELGAYWAFYSLWFARAVPQAKSYLVEPDYANLLSGQANFARYELPADITQAFVGAKSGWTKERVPVVSLDDYASRQGLERLAILHADIQGAEVDLLTGGARMLGEQRVDYVFISTHSNELHAECVACLQKLGYVVVVSSDLDGTYSVDGLIVAHRPGVAFPDLPPISERPKQGN